MKKLTYLTVAILTIISFAVHAQNVHMDGRASYYHSNLHGRKMANGQRYNRDSMTCAHRSLPFGTKLRVTNPVNGSQVVVTVADRGPYVRGRVIDLSYGAAAQLGILRAGVAMLQIEILPKEVEIPYRKEEVLELPKVEYGSVGVCYEYMPEWEKVKPEPKKTLKRKVSTANKGKKPASKPHDKQAAASQQQQSQQQHQPQQHQPQQQKKQDGSTWRSFFDKVKNGVTSLFD